MTKLKPSQGMRTATFKIDGTKIVSEQGVLLGIVDEVPLFPGLYRSEKCFKATVDGSIGIHKTPLGAARKALSREVPHVMWKRALS